MRVYTLFKRKLNARLKMYSRRMLHAALEMIGRASGLNWFRGAKFVQGKLDDHVKDEVIFEPKVYSYSDPKISLKQSLVNVGDYGSQATPVSNDEKAYTLDKRYLTQESSVDGKFSIISFSYRV